MAGVDSAISWLCCQARVLIDILILSEMERKISSNCEISKAEEWLLSILNKIGKTRIPDLEVEDFYEDFVKSNGGCNKEKLKPWEELVGIRLSLRILDNIMVEQFQRQEEQHLLIDNLSNEKLTLENEVGTLREQLSHLEQSSSESRQKSDAILKENWKLKDKLANLVKSYDLLLNELKLDQKVKMSSSRSRNPGQSISNSTQAHIEDKSFVPETLQILNLHKSANKRTLPVPSDPSDKIEICLPSEKLSCTTNYVTECPKSPLISRGIFPSKNKKSKVVKEVSNETAVVESCSEFEDSQDYPSKVWTDRKAKKEDCEEVDKLDDDTPDIEDLIKEAEQKGWPEFAKKSLQQEFKRQKDLIK